MNEHPIEGLMVTAMNSIRDMIDVNTIIGEPIQAPGDILIIPISKVGFGFASGGSEFNGETINEYKKKDKEEAIQYRLPFGGGSGAGVSINPVAFIVVQGGNVKLLPVCHSSSIDKLLDYVPDLIEKVNNMLNKNIDNKQKEKNIDYNINKLEKKEQEDKKREERIQRLEQNEKENKAVIENIRNEGEKNKEEIDRIKEIENSEDRKELRNYIEKLKEEIGAERKVRSKSQKGDRKSQSEKTSKNSPKIKKNIEIEFPDEEFIIDEDD